MPILRNLIFRAARRIAADERIQRKAAETYHDEIKPRAEAAWLATKPRIDKTRDDIKKIAQETKPAEEEAEETTDDSKEEKPEDKKEENKEESKEESK